MGNILIIGGHGLGDCLMSIQCASLVSHLAPTIKISARDEVYEPLRYLFSGCYGKIEHIHESYAADNALLKDSTLMKIVSQGFNEVYYVIPDLLFNNEYAFNFTKYGTNPQMIRSVRLLQGKCNQKQNIIYLGLMTTTDGYMYSEPLQLAMTLAAELPDYQIHFPIVSLWAGKEIRTIFVPPNLPKNLTITVDASFQSSLEVLKQSRYFIGTDNGPSHLAYHMAIPRLLLDPQFNRLPWMARWREDYLESIPISTSVEDITRIVSTNLKTPATTLVPRMTCLMQGDVNWSNLLWLKPY